MLTSWHPNFARVPLGWLRQPWQPCCLCAVQVSFDALQAAAMILSESAAPGVVYVPRGLTSGDREPVLDPRSLGSHDYALDQDPSNPPALVTRQPLPVVGGR